jgi:hypothetical protein
MSNVRPHKVTIPHVYADFNALPGAARRAGVQTVAMEITGYGTLQSLASQGIRLAEGMLLLLYEPNDIQCEAVAHFDKELLDPAGRVGAWVGVLDPSNVKDSAVPEPSSGAHPCISCGFDLSAHLLAHGRKYAEHCPRCGASVMEPMAPPHGVA